MRTHDDIPELELPDDVEALKAQVAKLEGALANEKATNAVLHERIRLLLAQRFGASSERVADGQLGLFNEAEELDAAASNADESDASIAVTAHERKRRGTRRPLPEHLPRIDVLHELDEGERVCPKDGTLLEPFGEEVSEQLDIEPLRVHVLRHRRVKYRCRCCEERLRTAPMPPQPIPKSMAAPGLLAFVATSKYVDGLPLHRISKQFERIGVELPRQTLARWMVQSGEFLRPLLALFHEQLLADEYLHCDETTVQVLEEPGKSAQSKSYMWVLAAGTGERPLVLYHYAPSREGQVARRLLQGYSGFLQTDGYRGYNEVVAENGITQLFCLAHARRFFTDGLKGLGINPNKLPAKPDPKARRLLTAIGYFRTLYAIERRIRGRPPDERFAVRQAEARPVLDRLHEWASELRPKVPPKTHLGKGLRYLLDHWDGLIRYLDDGRLEADNNRVENAIRPFTLGRRGWLFSATVEGAEASARLYSLVETAKANGLEPYAYLRHVFTELPKATTVDDVEALLPWNVPREKPT